ncbi:acyl-CoA/acyl-ACP dehydrogenase [Paraconexibacter antarcticus]|uniref:Acyl-CoA/acyl-ACP dehydrogenase n=1 Tax=Paraconexibacter antarcticus TaxID=2949664 RepID=A0ABY5DW16_9ACTN|nr:acyl-CoA dehydrogenase family protein [Paraconexibacter antarcticus]UTI66203.1 acyl-CoA/acyl-ACP dehydrogenase [Paraconexibacter antarcticus]
MIFALTDEQEMLRAAVRGALERSAPATTVREWLEAGDGRPATTVAVQQGWTGIGVPDTVDGGQGGGLVELVLAVEEHARASVPGALLAHTGLAVAAVLAAGGVADPLLQELAAGERLAALAVDAGSPLAAAVIDVAPFGDEWTASGTVAHVLGAQAADVILVPVDVDGDVRLFCCDCSQATVTPTPSADPGRDLSTVTLADARVVRVGASPVDLAVLGPRAAILVAADSLGAAQKMLDMTVQYIGEREQFGVPIGKFQSLKHTSAEMLVDVEVSRSATYFAAWSVDNGEPDLALHASVAKFVSGDAASRVADNAMSLHGAVGFTWEHDLHFLYKRAKVNLSLFGSPSKHRQLIGDSLPLRVSAGVPA